MIDKINELKQQNQQLAGEATRLESLGHTDEAIKLKREIYNNKIKLLDLISMKEQRFTISARELRDKVNSMKPAIRYETGVYLLDEKLKGGFEVGSLIQLGGVSGAGKTTLFLDIVANIAKYSKSIFFNFEMGDRRIVKRLTSKLKENQQWDNLHINSDTRNVDDLIMEITILADEGVKFFAVDSRMKLNLSGSEAEYQKIAKMSEKLSECAIKNDIIILMINQISEENIKNKRLSFKGSGDQMYHTDMALFIVINEDDSRTLICPKNRQDEFTFKIDLAKPIYEFTVEYQETENKNKIEMSVL